jgi:hypothetical protein
VQPALLDKLDQLVQLAKLEVQARLVQPALLDKLDQPVQQVQ